LADQFLLYQRRIYFFLNAIASSSLTRKAGGFIMFLTRNIIKSALSTFLKKQTI